VNGPWCSFNPFHAASSLSSVTDGPDDPAAIDQLIDQVRGWIDRARHVVVLTGAGISTDSGIPDFRGPSGVWTKNPGAERRADLQYYMSDPQVRRESWQQRLRHPAQTAEPNPGHLALVRLERRGKLDTLVTQNIDSLHHAAGSDPDRIVEVHGHLREVVCMSCAERAPMERALDRVRAGEDDPPCRSCGGILKSATISFGQNLVTEDLQRADQAARRCDLLLAVGSTLSVFPVADMVPLAIASGARVVIVNGSPTAMDSIADAVIRGRIGEVLPRLVDPLDGSDGPDDRGEPVGEPSS
jgi:NAD-dependent deacetylase